MVGKKMRNSSSGFTGDIKSESIDCKDLLGQLHRYERRQSKTTVDNSESLSDIDDEELCGYLNSKEEMHCKKALWEDITREPTKVGKKMRFSSRGFADVIKSESVDCKDLLGQLQRYERHQSKMTAVDDPEILSDIDNEEFCRYFNTKEEILFKKALWEEINREQTKKKCTKRAAEVKRAGAVKKASKVTIEAGKENVKGGNEKSRSSKINYDALDRLEADWSILET